MSASSDANLLDGKLGKAIANLRSGRPVLIYDADGREEEVDLFFAAETVTALQLRTLRRHAGGLVFLAVDPRVGAALDLPFLQDLYAEDTARHPILGKLIPNDIKYDTRSSFSLTINHRKTFTGITDNDRALTISEFGRLARRCLSEPASAVQQAFGESFRAPGHVALCVGAQKLLHQRKGHTEIGVAMARLADISPVLVGAEMLGDDGGARTIADARKWAEGNGGVLLHGKDVEAAWLKLEAAAPPA